MCGEKDKSCKYFSQEYLSLNSFIINILQKRRFCVAKEPLSQRQIEIIVFSMNYLYKIKTVFTC